MFKAVLVGVLSLSIGGGAYLSVNSQETQKPKEFCHLSPAKAASVSSEIQNPQDPPPTSPPSQEKPKPEEDPDYQPDDTPTHRRSPGDGCSRPNPGAEPGAKLNGVVSNTVGCVCKKKCTNGQVEEDLSKGSNGKYICKNACYKDRCFCPNPCKT